MFYCFFALFNIMYALIIEYSEKNSTYIQPLNSKAVKMSEAILYDYLFTNQ